MTVTMNPLDPQFKKFINNKEPKDHPSDVVIWYRKFILGPLKDLLGIERPDKIGIYGKLLGYFYANEC